MPNRIIKESLCDSDRISALTDFEFRLWIGLITQADDAGRGDARPAIIKGRVFPLRDRVSLKDIDGALHGLAAKGCVSLYEIDGKPYFLFPTWGKHQRIRDVKPKFPAPAEQKSEEDTREKTAFFSDFDNLPQIAADCGYNPIQSNTNTESNTNIPPQSPPRGEEEEKRSRFVVPSLDEIKAYCRERNNAVDAEAFYAFYESKGWYVGRNKMKSWKAAIITWEKTKKGVPKSNIPIAGELGNSFDTDDMFEAALNRSFSDHLAD